MSIVTHEVFNQTAAFSGVNLFHASRPLQGALALHAPALDSAPLQALGAEAGSVQMQAHARLANAHGPVLTDAVAPALHGNAALQAFWGPKLAATQYDARFPPHGPQLGDHANASSEVESHGAAAWLVGEPGRAVAQILAMGALTRLDCAPGTAGLMRQALSIALHLAAQSVRQARTAQAAVFAAFCDSRLDAAADVFGLLGAGHDLDLITQRAMPWEV
jgi:hypothetical protein